VLRFRLLPFEVEIEVDDPVAGEQLRYLANSVEQRGIPTKGTHRWRVRGQGPWTLEEHGDHVGRYGRIDDLLFVLYRRCYGRLGEHLQLGGWVALHGGLVRVAGRRAVVVGQKGAGKTTLMMQLLVAGHAVEGDEQVLTRGGLAVALPRAFHVKPGTADLLPQLAPVLRRSPATALSDGTPIVAFDPVAAGFEAATSVAPIDVAVVLRRRDGSGAGVRPLTTVAAAEAVVAHALPYDDSRVHLLQACARLLATARGFEVRGGDLAATARQLAEAVASS
jgi:hypothetical protein